MAENKADLRLPPQGFCDKVSIWSIAGGGRIVNMPLLPQGGGTVKMDTAVERLLPRRYREQ